MTPSKILMVGLHEGYAQLFSSRDDLELFLLEEPQLYARRENGYDLCDADHLRLSNYQQSGEFMGCAAAWHNEVGFDAVVPAWEYGVYASGAIAESLGLRWPGRVALDACTDKIRLRELLAKSEIAQPRWTAVHSENELTRFHRGEPVILKPSNRHASVGVVRVDSRTDIPAAWAECTTSDERRTAADRFRSTAYMAEEFIDGYQVSVETLVRAREVIFDNVTLMATAGGPYFPILAVTVPAPIPASEYEAAVEASHDLVRALDVVDGMIHSEWKIRDGVPHLIESAARVPGAFTAELAAEAYAGFDMYAAQIENLAGRMPEIPESANAIAAVRWFHPPSGRVTGIRGADALAKCPAVLLHRIKVKKGDVIPVCRDGWQRVGYFAVRCRDAEELHDVVEALIASVQFDVDIAEPLSVATNAIGVELFEPELDRARRGSPLSAPGEEGEV